jgi:hypothetical protein
MMGVDVVGNGEASADAEGVKREWDEGNVTLAGEGERNANIEDLREGHDYNDDDCLP